MGVWLNNQIMKKLSILVLFLFALQSCSSVKEYEKENVVFITIAGMSNALSGFADAQTHCPVIACPPYSDKFGGADIFSSLRMPSGVAPLTVLSPENAAFAAAKIFGLTNPAVQEKIIAYQTKRRNDIEEADAILQKK